MGTKNNKAKSMNGAAKIKTSKTEVKNNKQKLTFRQKISLIKNNKAVRIAFDAACIVTSLAILAIVLCVKIPSWQLNKATANYNKVMTECIESSIRPDILVSNTDISSLTDDALRDLLFTSGLFDTTQFDDELKSNESYTLYADYTHENIPLNYLMSMLASNLAVNVNTDVISLTEYIKNNIGPYDLTADSLIEFLNNYCYNLMIIENLINSHSYISFLYETLYAEYAAIPDEEHVLVSSPVELTKVYEDFVTSATLRTELVNISSEIHRILESYYYENITEYQKSPLGNATFDILNLSFFSMDATTLYDLLYDYYLAAIDYEVYGTQYNLYIDNTTDTDKLQKAATKFSDRLGYNAVYYGVIVDDDPQFNVFENICSTIAKRFRSKKENDELVRLIYQQMAGYNTLGETIPNEVLESFNGEFIFWNMMFGKLNTEAEAMSSDDGIYISANNYMNSMVEQMIAVPGKMTFSDETVEAVIKNLCWAKAIQTLYSTVTTTSGIKFDSESQTTTIPEELTEQQNAALNLVYAWVNYAVRYAVTY